VTVPNVIIHAKVADLVTHDGSWNLIQQSCVEVLKCETVLSVTMSQAHKTEMVDNVRNVIVLYFEDKVLREVAKETTVSAMWLRLKSLVHRQ
jgi:hypothetical protein